MGGNVLKELAVVGVAEEVPVEEHHHRVFSGDTRRDDQHRLRRRRARMVLAFMINFDHLHAQLSILKDTTILFHLLKLQILALSYL